MDAAEADSDIKLYKASGELLLEVQAKIPRIVKTSTVPPKYRKWVLSSKVFETAQLLDRFQEWPQLLDPYLAKLVQVLVDAYLWYGTRVPMEYMRLYRLQNESSDILYPLPRAVAIILYSLCKVRGRKVILRLLNNEPRYVEPLLKCFGLWASKKHTESSNNGSIMTWEERYIQLLWLSHLMLAPFELSTISGLSINLNTEGKIQTLYANLPDVSASLVSICLEHIYLSSKAREAANTLLVRLSLRSDMQKLGLPQKLVNWALDELATSQDSAYLTGYRHIGLLELIFGILNSASDSEVAPFLSRTFQLASLAATSSEEHYKMVRDPAPARKLLIKIMRSATIHALSIEASHAVLSMQVDLQTMLEDCIQSMLDLLADKDTPVRQAASKALSLICLKLDAEMSTEVVEAVVASLNENVLLEDTATGKLFPVTDITKDATVKYKKNVNAVDPLRWHGCMLTLGHLLFRRSLPLTQLPGVIEALVMGLNFEQRSNVGTSVGVGVRDAACFGVWSLARKYSSYELNTALVPATLLPNPASFGDAEQSTTIQLIATHLALSACLDPSSNLRRGSSAALQELIGRHPDIIAEGIPVVQTIDYHAVARRSRAVTEVAVAASRLDSYYHGALLYALLGWRGARATDADSRRQAAFAGGLLTTMASANDMLTFIRELVLQVNSLKLANTGSNAAARHGLLCLFASIMSNLSDIKPASNEPELLGIVKPLFENMSAATGNIDGRVTNDIELVLEGISRTILACANFMSGDARREAGSITAAYAAEWAASTQKILETCTISGNEDFLTDTASHANVAVLKLLDGESQSMLASSWMDQGRQGKTNFTCKGLIATLGQAFEFLNSAPNLERVAQPIVMYLSKVVEMSYPIELKVNALQSCNTILTTTPHLGDNIIGMLMKIVRLGLTDYTVDRRGDIGSSLRLEAIETARLLLKRKIEADQRRLTLTLLIKLAAEKLAKIRFQAWKCLEECLEVEGVTIRIFDHHADVSSVEYFRAVADFLHQPIYREAVLIGIMTSVAGSTEEVSRACGQALIAFIEDQDVVTRQSLIASFVQSLSGYLADNAKGEDHKVIPAIDLLAFVIEHMLACQSSLYTDPDVEQIWITCQKIYITSSTFVRLEAMVRLYSALTLLEAYRSRALDKLTRLLLHRWPKIRGLAADAIFLSATVPSLRSCDWDAPVSDNKASVLALRKELGVAGLAAAKLG